jgi:hypothetical protein
MHSEELKNQNTALPPKNKLYTRGYFIKRMKDARIYVVPLVEYNSSKFYPDDIRKWTVLIDPGHSDIILTCHKISSNDFWFKLITPGGEMKIKTMSADVVANQLLEIINSGVTDNVDKK